MSVWSSVAGFQLWSPPSVIVESWYPPTRENWEFLVWLWQFFPLFTATQWLTDFFPQGKTSINSKLNLPGKWAWMFMELPGVLTVWYLLYTIPPTMPMIGHWRNLPVGNLTMAGIYTIHYVYRAVLSPLFLNPSMSPIHPIVFFSAFGWQVINGLGIGGWVAGYGPVTADEWSGRLFWVTLGLFVWVPFFLGNVFHDDELREIRRAAMRRQKKEIEKKKSAGKANVDKVYMMPQNGLFQYILFPHYLCEWIEWAGFWMIGGPACVPARSFLLNEIAAMTPRAISGKRWYVERFGQKEVGSRKAIIPGIL